MQLAPNNEHWMLRTFYRLVKWKLNSKTSDAVRVYKVQLCRLKIKKHLTQMPPKPEQTSAPRQNCDHTATPCRISREMKRKSKKKGGHHGFPNPPPPSSPRKCVSKCQNKSELHSTSYAVINYWVFKGWKLKDSSTIYLQLKHVVILFVKI